MTTDQTPEATSFRTVPPEIAPVVTGWQAWWEDHDMWDGFVLYADLATAKAHAAVGYIGEEYGWVPGDDPDDEAPETTLTWVFEHARWHLLDNGKSTLVQLYKTATYAPAVPSAAAPPTQAALTEAERTMLAYALNQAQLRMWSTGKYTDEDQAAVTSLRRLAEAPQPETQTRDCPACDAKITHDEHCPTPESHNWGCGCPSDVAAAIASCPGYEMSPSPCRCPCYGCKHHCGAHNPPAAPAVVAQPGKEA